MAKTSAPAPAASPRGCAATLADYVRLPRYAYLRGLVNYRRQDDMIRAVPLGEGFVDLPAFFAGLKDGGFQGYVAYEMCSPLRGGPAEENLDRQPAAPWNRSGDSVLSRGSLRGRRFPNASSFVGGA